MLNEPNPPSSAPKPRWLKAIIAQPIRATSALLVLIAVAVLGVRSAMFALSEKSYKSTARILVKGIQETYDTPFRHYGNAVNTTIADICSDLIDKRVRLRMHAEHSDIQAQICQTDATKIPETDIIVVSATAPDPVYAQTYLDAALNAYIVCRKEELAVAQAQQAHFPEAQSRLRKELDAVTIIESPSTAVRLLPRFTFFRLF